MRVDLSPQRITAIPGQPVVLTVSVFNTASVISAHRVRVLGVDERWVAIDNDQLSLFPERSGLFVITITLPPGIPAGARQVAVEVSELTPPARTHVVEAALVVPAELNLKLDLDPVTASGGRSTTFGVVLENKGNTEIPLTLAGADEEDQVRFTFAPETMTLAPGERVTAAATVAARRKLVGTPKVRPFTVEAGSGIAPVSAFGSFIQKPLLSRGAIALVGLLIAISVFAGVITTSLSRVVDKSAADRDLVLQVVQGGRSTAATEAGAIGGTVTLLTSSAGVGGVTVEAFDAGNTAAAIASAATTDTGEYSLPGLGQGNYKLRFRGAGFSELWYPQSLTPDNAQTIEVRGAPVDGIDVRLGGIPATIAGTVTADDPTGATVSLALPSSDATVVPAAGAAPGEPGTDAAIVQTATVDSSGAFLLEAVPSPSTYQLIVSKAGFATEVQTVSVGGGEERTGIQIALRKGDGLIAGRVTDAAGDLGGATIVASDGRTTITTVSLTQDDVGAFTLRSLPTPATYTILVSKPGYATETVTLSLSAAQQLTGVGVTLGGGEGSVAGRVVLADGTPAGGVSVTVSDGELTVQTATVSVGAVGTYRLEGLAIPGTYTITFSRPDLASQTRAVDLDAFGGAELTDVDATMQPATATLSGTTTVQGGAPLGEIEVVLTSGETTYRVRSASVPVPGAYRIDNIKPGTYTVSFNRPGAKPTSQILGFAAGERKTFDPVVDVPASVTGQVLRRGTASNAPLADAEVRLYIAGDFPGEPLRTVSTDSQGKYTITDLEAPESYVVEFAFPEGTPGQTTLLATTEQSKQTVLKTIVLDVG